LPVTVIPGNSTVRTVAGVSALVLASNRKAKANQQKAAGSGPA
jgi:hypothetical protein